MTSTRATRDDAHLSMWWYDFEAPDAAASHERSLPRESNDAEMIVFNYVGLGVAIATALASAGLSYLVGGGGETFLLLFAASSATVGFFYDRLDKEEGLKAYYLWYRGTLGSSGGIQSRIAVFCTPLVFIPAAVLVFSVFIPAWAGDPLPSVSYFTTLALITSLAVGFTVKKHPRISIDSRGQRLPY